MMLKRTGNLQTDPRQVVLGMLRVLPAADDALCRSAHQEIPAGDAESWTTVVEEAGRHGVLGIIAPHLVGLPLPDAPRRFIEQHTTVSRLWHEHTVASQDHAVSTLDAAGVRVCVIKGPTLAERLYADPAARTSMDIDLLVAPSDIERAAAALDEAGYAGDSVAYRSYLLQYAHHLHFSLAERPPIELHFHAYVGFGIIVPAVALTERALIHRTASGMDVFVPSPEDEIVYLAVHAAGHSFIRLVWLYDLKLLIMKTPRLDWDAVAERSAALGVLAPVSYALHLLTIWLGAPLNAIPASLKHRGLRVRLADGLLAEVSMPQKRSVRDNIGGLFFTSLLCDRLSSSAWLLRHHLTRAAKRRLQQLVPGYVPAEWSA